MSGPRLAGETDCIGPQLTIALLIPAYEPGRELIGALERLSGAAVFPALILVNDGSSPASDSVFEDAAKIPGVYVIRHAVNLGKGAALKSGFRYASKSIPDLSGVVTADADGQHLPEDILKVAARLAEWPESLVLGVRNFEGDVPLRSRFGNRLSRLAVRLLARQNVTDTQTGLRGVPASLLPALLQLTGSGYEFELEMLLAARRHHCQVNEVPIQTVYAAGNPSSHFRPIVDSLKIGAVLLGSSAPRGITAVLLLAGALSAYGLFKEHIFSQTIWFSNGLHRAEIFLALSIAALTPLLLFASRYLWPVVLILLLGATSFAAGPLAPLTVLFVLYSATVIGTRLFGEIEQSIALMTGSAILIAILELLVRLPWNYSWTYGLLMLAPIVIAPRIAWKTMQSAAALLRPRALTSSSERSAAGVLTVILTAHWLMVLEPEVSTDGLAMHLAIADGLAWKHQFAFDLPHNVWAVMPMGADWLFALVYLPGGEFAARLLNYTFLLVIIALLYSACRRMVSVASALWVCALFAMTPLVQLVTGSLFIENVLAAVLLAGVAAVWRFEETGRRHYVYAAALLFGTALHIKLGAVAVLLPALILLTLAIRRKPKWLYAQVALIEIVAGAPPFVIAAVKTANPIFPFLNQDFHSPLLASGAKVDETRFHEPLSITTPYDLSFHTRRYYEGQDGSFGLQYLLLLPASLLLVRRRNYVGWSATVIGLGGCLIVLLTQPNLRYLYPSLPFLHVTIAFLVAHFTARSSAMRALIACSFAGSLGIDLCLFPSSNWYHKDFYTNPGAYLKEYAPRRILIADLNRNHPGEAVFLPGDSAIAGIRARVLRNHWHDQETKTALGSAHDGDEVLELMRRWNVKRLLMPIRTEDIGARVLREFARACIATDVTAGDSSSGHVRDACLQKVQGWKKRRDALNQEGRVYDDADSGVELIGKWVRDDKFPLASGGTVTYSNTPGAIIRFVFEGTGIAYVYTAAPNRGFAGASVDGTPRPDLDLYRSETQWQSLDVVTGLTRGRHVIEIKVNGKSNPESKDCYVDLDAFVVKP